MQDLNKLRELKSLYEEELLEDDEYQERKFAILDRMLANASQVVLELPSVIEVGAAKVKKQQPQGVGDSGPPMRRDSDLAMERKQERLARRLSQNVRRSAAPEMTFEAGVLEQRTCLMDEAPAKLKAAVAWCRKNKCKWNDPDFPTERRSIATKNMRLLKNFDHWERLTERSPNPSLFVGGSGSGDVIQGEVGDCWALGALAMCATRQDDLLYPLFVAALPEYGVFQIRFFIDAKWRVVTVDDQVPVKRLGSMIFAHCKDEDEYWVALVEKAMAKMYGKYENLGSGNFSEAMSNFTGEGSEAFELTPDMKHSTVFWDKLRYYVEEEFLMGCSIEGVGEHDNGMGLLTGHAYGIMDCRVTKKDGVKLLQYFNPWGMKEWTGAWSDGAAEWTPELERELDQTDEDDGMFWMTYEDFLDNFNMFSVCRLLTDDVGKIWEKCIFANEFNSENAGGCCNFDSWVKNPQYWLTVTQNTQMFFHMARQDRRVVGKPKFTEAIGCYVFIERDLTRRKMHRYPNDLFEGHQPLFIDSREYSYSCEMPPGNYILMPCTFDPNQHFRFWLTVYAEDPVQCGMIGYGPSRKEDIVRVDTTEIAKLNRPDEDDEPPPKPVVVAAPPPKQAQPKKAAPLQAKPDSCSVCGLPSKGYGKVFRMNGKRIHVKCFKCVTCGIILDPSDFYQNGDGDPVCEDHVE